MRILQRLVGQKRPEPSYPVLPATDEHDETNIRGIYAVGELAGTPLVRLGLKAGHDLVQRIGPELLQSRPDEGSGEAGGDASSLLYDVVIVGSGSSGFAATVAAKDLGLRYVTLEGASFANTFVTMTKGKWLFAEPENVTTGSRVRFEECRKEELLDHWRAMRVDEQLDVREHEAVREVSGTLDNFTVTTIDATYRARRVLLCMGKAGNPRKLNVPGEKNNADKIFHRLLDPADFSGNDILIVGAGDVACEAAIALAADESNRVTMSAIDKEFSYPKKRNIDAVRALEAEGKLRIVLDSSVKSFSADTVQLQHGDGSQEQLKYNAVFEMIGAELPIRFLRKVGIRLNTDWYPARWMYLAASFAFVYSLYALKSYGKGAIAWPYESLIAPDTYANALRAIFRVGFVPFGWLFSEQSYQDILADKGFQQGYLYSLLYTIAMLVFGYLALVRWRAKSKRQALPNVSIHCSVVISVGLFPDSKRDRRASAHGEVCLEGVGSLSTVSALL